MSAAPMTHDHVAMPLPERSDPAAGASSALGHLLDSWVVLPEEWDELAPATRDELVAAGPARLLVRLVDLHLLTPYQAEVVRAGVADDLVIGQYRILDVIGRGGMGTVYRAEHLHLRKEVAVKVLERTAGDDSSRQHRFLLEARAVARLRHPHIVACLDAGRHDGAGTAARDYYVMEFIPGQDLQGLVRNEGPLPVRRACDLFRQVAEALGEAHRHGLVHRDIKPSNLLITPDWRAMVLDFGLALHPRRNVTEPGTVLGTVGYMAPEQAVSPSEVDARADLFSLGASLYWALAGRDPFPENGGVLADFHRRLTAPSPPVRAARPEVPAELGDLIARLMDPNPERRPPSMAAAAAALTSFARWQPDRTTGRAPDPPAVLVVDDDAQIRTYVREIAGDEFACEDAVDGPAAWAALGRRRFDLVLLDVDLPGVGGSELVTRIRREGPDPQVKVLLTSGAISPESLGRLLQDKADDFIGKPFTPGEFRSRVRALLARGQGAAGDLHQTGRRDPAGPARADLRADPALATGGLATAVSRLLQEIGVAAPGHAGRVRRYVRALSSAVAGDGEYARLKDPAYLEMLAEVAPVYDVGLLVVPSYVLMKPARLDPDDLDVVRGHTTTGFQVLVDLAGGNAAGMPVLSLAAEVARSHHERWDGSGYPDGQTGPTIALSARVLAIASVYEAMRSRRPHRPAFGHARTARYIAAEAAGQFDPALRAAFEASAPRFDHIFRGRSE